MLKEEMETCTMVRRTEDTRELKKTEKRRRRVLTIRTACLAFWGLIKSNGNEKGLFVREENFAHENEPVGGVCKVIDNHKNLVGKGKRATL